MDNNGFDQRTYYNPGGSFGEPSWDDFSIDDERRARSRFSRFFLSVFIYNIAANAVALITQIILIFALGKDAAAELMNTTWFIWVMNIGCMYVISFPILYLIVRPMRSTVRTKRKMRASEFFILLLIGQAFMYVGNIVGTFLNDIISVFVGGEIENTTSELISESPLWIILLVVVVIGPIVEELIFRKLLMDKLGMYGDRIAIIVSAVSFGIFHGNLYQLFYATLLGLILAFIYSKTSNIIYPILMHMIINFWGSFVPMLFYDKLERFYELYDAMLEEGTILEENMAEFSQLILPIGFYSMLQMGMVIAGIILFFKMRRRIFVSDRCEIEIPKRKRGTVIVGNVGTILFIVFSGLTMLMNILNPLITRIMQALAG